MLLIFLASSLAIAASQTDEQSLCVRTCQAEVERSSMISQRGMQGKRGPVGEKGGPGLKGSKGEQGEVNYDRIEEAISQRIEEALRNHSRKFSEISHALAEARTEISQLRNETNYDVNELRRRTSLKQKFMKLEKIAGRLYHFGETMKSWQGARDECKLMGGDLAAKGIRESQTFNKLYQLGIAKRKSYWIGMSDITTEGRYEFVDGVIASTSDSYWDPHEPNDKSHRENCMEIRSHERRKLNDFVCSIRQGFICEFEIA